MRKSFIPGSLCLFLLGVLWGCSGDREREERSAIDKMSDRVAEQAVENIRQPMQQAKRQMEAVQEARTRAVNEAVENSGQ